MRSALLVVAVYGVCAFGSARASDPEEAPAPTPLNLVCEGNWRGGNTGGSARFYFRFDGERGTMQVPEDLRPPSRHWLGDGWINLEEIVMNASSITARARFNFMADLRIKIDRMHGEIDLKGSFIQYAGVCEPYDPEALRPAF